MSDLVWSDWRGDVEAVQVLTIGHSTVPYERFLSLLHRAGVTAVADVRSAPYSRQYPHFSRDELSEELRQDGISYVFLGKELGGRPSDRRFYCEGVADYEKMAQAPEFGKGLDRLVAGAEKHRIALMCSEREPLDCHRCLLVGRALVQRGVKVAHILHDGSIASHAQMEEKLLEITGRNTRDLFAPQAEQLAAAYRERGRKVAFTQPQADPHDTITAERSSG